MLRRLLPRSSVRISNNFSLPAQKKIRGQGKIKVGTSWTYARPFFSFFLSVFPELEDWFFILENVNSQQLTVRFSMVVSSIRNFYLLIFDELFRFILFFGHFGRKFCLDSCRAQLLSEYQTGGKEIDARLQP